LVFVYSVVSIIVNASGPDPHFVPWTVMKLIALVAWLTIIATLVPRNDIPIPVRRPLPELLYLVVWGIADVAIVVCFWSLASSNSSYSQVIHYAIVFGRLAIAALFAVIFRYSAQDLGIRLKHWRLYLGLIIIALPVGKHFLEGEYFHMLIGAVSLGLLFVLYLSNRQQWHGLADDLRSLRPYVLPILLCAFVTVVLNWGQNQSLDRFLHLLWPTPLRVFDTPTYSQGAMPEEFYYRLGLQTRLNCLMPFGWASLLQGIGFDAIHIPQGLAKGTLLPSYIPWSFTDGIVNALAVGYLWRRSRNLPVAILFHMAGLF